MSLFARSAIVGAGFTAGALVALLVAHAAQLAGELTRRLDAIEDEHRG